MCCITQIIIADYPVNEFLKTEEVNKWDYRESRN